MRMLTADQKQVLNLRAGEVVEVRSRSEILATLDPDGKLDALPFMPEMLQHCGKQFTVYKRADKACDTVGKTGSRRMRTAVHLERLRCDGTSHGGCQSSCLLYWKEAWLKRVALATTASTPAGMREADGQAGDEKAAGRSLSVMCTENVLIAATLKKVEQSEPSQDVYACQATELPKATS